MSDYVDVSRARQEKGVRLVLTRGVPGPWGESAKGILHVKGIPFVRVAQAAGEPNDELFEWTGCRNAPVAIADRGPACSGWSEILWLAEREKPEPSLVPDDPEERIALFGLGAAICGPDGFGWNRRLMLLHGILSNLDPAIRADPPAVLAIPIALGERYGYTPAAGQAAEARVVEILELLSRVLERQRRNGSAFLVGRTLSAVDIWWSAFAALVEPLPEEQCPMNPGLRASYTAPEGAVRDALDPALVAHRDRIYAEHLELPVRT